MSDREPPITFDQEFDEVRLPTQTRLRSGVPSYWPLQPWDYQRLIVNPFLFLLVGLICGLIASRLLPGRPYLRPVLLGVLPLLWLVLAGHEVRYHCCDCGGDGPFARWRDHQCYGVWKRSQENQRGRFPFPSAPLQAQVWGLIGVALLVLLVILRLGLF